MWYSPSRSQRPSSKNSNKAWETLFWVLLVRVSKRLPNTSQATATALRCSPEAEDKQVLVAKYTRHRALRPLELEATWKPPSCGRPLLALCKLPKEGSSRQFYPAMMSMNHSHHQQSTITLRVQSWYSYLDAQIGLQSHSTRQKSCPGVETLWTTQGYGNHGSWRRAYNCHCPKPA